MAQRVHDCGRMVDIVSMPLVLEATKAARDVSAFYHGKAFNLTYDCELSQTARGGYGKCDKPRGNRPTDAAVFVNNEYKHVVIAFEGTNGKQPQDWLANIRLYSGIKDPQFKDAIAIVKEAQAKYPEHSFEMIGHSLGAAQAAYAAAKTDLPATAFHNPGMRVWHLSDDEKEVMKRQTINVQVQGDPVNAIVAKPLGRSVHIALPHAPGQTIINWFEKKFMGKPDKHDSKTYPEWDKMERRSNAFMRWVRGGPIFKVYEYQHDSLRLSRAITLMDNQGINFDDLVRRIPKDEEVYLDGRSYSVLDDSAKHNRAIYAELKRQYKAPANPRQAFRHAKATKLSHNKNHNNDANPLIPRLKKPNNGNPSPKKPHDPIIS